MFRLFVFVAAVTSPIFAWRHFRRERHCDGNLIELLPQTDTPPDEWFTQTLNHFDAANNRTWQQVRVLFSI